MNRKIAPFRFPKNIVITVKTPITMNPGRLAVTILSRLGVMICTFPIISLISLCASAAAGNMIIAKRERERMILSIIL
jgi:hypothetical protein